MRKILLGAGAALAMSSGAMAQNIVGYGELSYGSLSASSGGISLDVLTLGLNANVPFSTGWNFQVESWGSSLSVGGVGGAGTMGIYAHIFQRDPATWAWGFLAGYENINTSGTLITLHSIGLEAAKFWGPAVVLASGRWASVSTGGSSLNSASLDLTGRYFFNSNLKAEGGLRYNRLSAGGASQSFWVAHAEVEAGFGSTVSGFAAAKYLFGGGLAGTNITTITAGIRLNFNAGTLQDQSTSGPLFSTESFLF